MQKYYLNAINFILKFKTTSDVQVYQFLCTDCGLSKKASIKILDALIDNPLFNFNFETHCFTLT